MDKKLVEKMK
jgi:hypothetical protein